MADLNTQTVTANTSTSATTVQAPEAKAEPQDIVSRASSFKVQPEKSGDAPQETKFKVTDIEKITDPVAKKYAQDAYNSMQADYTRKTQELAEQRRQAEMTQSLKSRGFTVSEIDELLANPAFVQAATEKQRMAAPQQVVAQNGNAELTEEEFSYLTPEMQKVYLQQKQNNQMLAQLQGQLQSAKVEKEDVTLKSKYSNYDPKAVNDIYTGMMNGSIQATREHLWKVSDYDDAVKRAYALGRQDEKTGITQARAASTQVNGVTTQTMESDTPVRLKGESFQDHWKRLAQAAKAKLGQT